jgi:hypothetical protein
VSILGSNGFIRRRLPAAASWWLSGGISSANAIGVYQPIGAASLVASYTNLANPGVNDAAPGVAPTWASGTGWTFNGSTQFLNTGIAPQNGWSMIVRWAIAARDSTNRGIVGSRETASNRFGIATPWSTNQVFYQYASTTRTPVRSVLSGVDAITPEAYYGDGVGTTWTPSGTFTAGAVQIGLVSNTGTHFLGDIQAVAIYDTTLTSDQVASVTTALNLL